MRAGNIGSVLLGLALVAVLAWGVLVRVQLWPVQAAHIDDLLAPRYMNMDFYTLPHVRHRLYDSTHAKFRSPFYGALRALDKRNLLDGTFPIIRYFFKIDDLALNSTYAPGQYLLTGLLVWDGDSYAESLRDARLPSLVFGCLALALCSVWLASVFGGSARDWDWSLALATALVGATLVAASGEAIVLCAHSASYAIAPLLVVLLLWLIGTQVRQRSTERMYNQRWLPRGWRRVAILSGVFCWFQYQLVFFLPVVAVAYIAVANVRRPTTEKFGQTLQILFWQVLLLAPLVVRYLAKSAKGGIHWNAGPEGEYAFEGGDAAYVWHFFSHNIPVTIGAMLTPVLESHPWFRPLAIVATVLVGLGWLALLTSKTQLHRVLAWVCLTVAAVWVVAVVGHVFTLSPTRHSLVLVPLLVLCIAAVPAWVLQRLTQRRNPLAWSAVGVSVLVIIGAGTWVVQAQETWQEELPLRSDAYNEREFVHLVRQQGATAVLGYGWTYNTQLMPALRSRVQILNYNDDTQPTLVPAEVLDSLPRRMVAAGQRVPLTRVMADSLAMALQRACGGCPVRYRVTTLRAHPGQREHEFTQHTRNGRNGQYIYLLELWK